MYHAPLTFFQGMVMSNYDPGKGVHGQEYQQDHAGNQMDQPDYPVAIYPASHTIKMIITENEAIPPEMIQPVVREKDCAYQS